MTGRKTGIRKPGQVLYEKIKPAMLWIVWK